MLSHGADRERYEEARRKVMEGGRLRQGVGTLSEKTLHAVLKNYYEPDVSRQEVSLEGLVADIFTGEEILEIQTGNFFALKKKLSVFLPLFPLTIVYPIPYRKWLIWIDGETGELSKKRKSPKTGSLYDAFHELYKIKEYLAHPNLRLRFVLLDMEEYRLLDGWGRGGKRGSHRNERFPLELVEEVDFLCPRDYLRLVPDGLGEAFAVRDFAQAAHIRQDRAGRVVYVLHALGQLERVGKKGRAYLYRVKEK